MKHPALKYLLPALGIAALAVVGTRTLLQVEVHEWGILVDRDSVSSTFQQGYTATSSRLNRPSARCDSMQQARNPQVAWPDIMEASIPVLTFRSRLPIPMTVGVRFPAGAPTVSYPSAERNGQELSWKIRLGSPAGARDLRVPDSLAFLLDSEVSTVGTDTGAPSTFLFYEGTLPAAGKLQVRFKGKDSLVVTNRTGNRIHDIHVSRSVRDTAVAGGISRLEAGESVTLGRSDSLDPRLIGLRGGLSESEARAFAKAWLLPAWFSSYAQVSWSYRLDQATADRLLPLSFSWPFVKVRRVLVVAHREAVLDAQGCPEGMLTEPDNGSIIDAILAGGAMQSKSGALRRPVPPPARGERP